MFTKVMKWFAVSMLLLVTVLPGSPGRELAAVVVFAAALAIGWQAFRGAKYFWVTAFVAIAVLFNPLVVVRQPGLSVLWLNIAVLVIFLLAVTTPRLTVASITSQSPRRESL